MSKTNIEEPNRLIAFCYVLVQAIILGLLIFANISFGLKVREFTLIGTTLKLLGIIGILVSAYSIRRSLTAMPLPKEGGELATNGLYKFVRHPMYTSVLAFSFGITLSSGEVYKYILVVGLAVLFYSKSIYEEKFLAQKYDNYSKYAAQTPRFLPRIKV